VAVLDIQDDTQEVVDEAVAGFADGKVATWAHSFPGLDFTHLTERHSS